MDKTEPGPAFPSGWAIEPGDSTRYDGSWFSRRPPPPPPTHLHRGQLSGCWPCTASGRPPPTAHLSHITSRRPTRYRVDAPLLCRLIGLVRGVSRRWSSGLGKAAALPSTLQAEAAPHPRALQTPRSAARREVCRCGRGRHCSAPAAGASPDPPSAARPHVRGTGRSPAREGAAALSIHSYLYSTSKCWSPPPNLAELRSGHGCAMAVLESVSRLPPSHPEERRPRYYETSDPAISARSPRNDSNPTGSCRLRRYSG
jgi:hypothetical protein